MTYEYCVAFMHQDQNGIEYGNVGLKRNTAIKNMDDLEQIREELKYDNGDAIVFLNVFLLGAN